MAKMIDIEFIKKWVDISDEELMQRLVKDALGLQEEARENQRKAIIAERKSDTSYDMEFIKRFFDCYDYLAKYFSDEEIEAAVKNHMGKRDLTEETWTPNMREDLPYGIFVKHKRGKYTESRGSWTRERECDGTVYLIRNRYQHIHGTSDVIRELLLLRCPWIADYNINIYDVNDRNDWIYFNNPEKNTGYSTTSLYVPFSAIMDHDTDKVVKTHCDYWHDYGNGKYDEQTKEFMNSDFVKILLSHIAG